MSVRCHKACHLNNLACMRDPVHMLTYTVLSLPTYTVVDQPQEIAILRTSLPAHYANGDFDVVFEMLKTDDHYSYDVVKRVYQGYVIGVVRQVRPIAGPRDLELQVALNFIKPGFVSHRNIVVINIIISEFSF
ncbi:fibulin-1-like [Hippocampus zosterae]|uniref:fibulin-1-like n=1 Tax=Hippocampus zosterae TaxID=109293 RepID=UPI00223E340F|nr:fibulin-1-like [Hippocampus zosterae]